MLKWAMFREILLPSSGVSHVAHLNLAHSQNVAHLNIVVHDVINLLYYEY